MDTGTVDTVYVGARAIVDAFDVMVILGMVAAMDFAVADAKNTLGGLATVDACMTVAPLSIVDAMAVEAAILTEFTAGAVIVLVAATDAFGAPTTRYDDNGLANFDALGSLDEVGAWIGVILDGWQMVGESAAMHFEVASTIEMGISAISNASEAMEILNDSGT